MLTGAYLDIKLGRNRIQFFAIFCLGIKMVGAQGLEPWTR
jgi:hypothetical protein